MERENKMALKLLPLKEKLIKLELSVKDDDVLFNQFAILSTDFKEYNKLVIAKSQKSEDFGRDLNDRTNLFIDNHWEELRKRIVLEKRGIENPSIDNKEENNTPLSSPIKMPYYLIWFLFLFGGFILGVFSQYQYHIINNEPYFDPPTSEAVPDDSTTLHTSPSTSTQKPTPDRTTIQKDQEESPTKQISEEKIVVISITELTGGTKLEKVSDQVKIIMDEVKKINKYKISFSDNEQNSSIRLSIGFSNENQEVEYELQQISTGNKICSTVKYPQSLQKSIENLVHCIKNNNLE